jgi:hypothetical protein
VASALHGLFTVYGLVTAFLLDHFDLLPQIVIAHIKGPSNALGFLISPGNACAAPTRRFGNL